MADCHLMFWCKHTVQSVPVYLQDAILTCEVSTRAQGNIVKLHSIEANVMEGTPKQPDSMSASLTEQTIEMTLTTLLNFMDLSYACRVLVTGN